MYSFSRRKQKVFNTIAIFSMCFLAAFIIAAFFAPVRKSDAETATSDTGVYTASIANDSSTRVNITPTGSQAVYTATNQITYTNTCPHGFNITMSAASDNTNLIRAGSDNLTKDIPTIATGTALNNNTWGYSIDNGVTYKTIPALSSPSIILNTTSATTNPSILNILYGIKLNNELPSGVYSNDIVYTISVKPECISYDIVWDLDGGTQPTNAEYPVKLRYGAQINLSTLKPSKNGYSFEGWSNGLTTFSGDEVLADINTNNEPSVTMTAIWELPLYGLMQSFNCSDISVGDIVRLKDARDNNAYNVKKFGDGKCRTMDNLRIINKTITWEDSNLPNGESFTIPQSDNIAEFRWIQDPDTYQSAPENFGVAAAYIDVSEPEYGAYYNFYTATAGWGAEQATVGTATKDICPKGWRLPTVDDNYYIYRTFSTIDELVPGYNILYAGEVVPINVGTTVTPGTVYSKGYNEYHWSSTVYEEYSASHGEPYYFHIWYNSYINPYKSMSKFYRLSVRCLTE